MEEKGQSSQPKEVARTTIALDEKGVLSNYSNFSYATGTREGLLIGFGNYDWQPGSPVRTEAKIELSYYNAKQLLITLNQAIQKCEQIFGPLEMDVNKRVVKTAGKK